MLLIPGGSRQAPAGTRGTGLVRRIVRAYDDPVVRAYCLARFAILRQRFLFEIGQYLPRSGRVLDVGCGFGLFALYFAMRAPHLRLVGFDRDAYRIGLAREAAEKLGVRNADFHVGDASDFSFSGGLSAAYMIDLIHHIPVESVPQLLTTIAQRLDGSGRLIIKDVDAAPTPQLAFTWLLDKMMDVKAPVRYWAPSEIHPLLEALGFEVFQHRMIDYLPYPHILYISSPPRGSIPA